MVVGIVLAVVTTKIEGVATMGRHHSLLGVVEAGEEVMKVAAALMTIVVQLVVAATAVVLDRVATSHPEQAVAGGKMTAIVDGEKPAAD